MALQRRAPSTIRRHFLRAVVRVSVLVAGDLGVFLLCRQAVRSLRSGALGSGLADVTTWTAPPGVFAQWQFAAAMLVGLAIAGAYRQGDCRRDPWRILTGVALAGGLVLWGDLWVRGLLPVALNYAAVVLGVSLLLILARLVIDRAAARTLPLLRPEEKVLFIGDPNDPVSIRTGARLSRAENMSSVGWVTVPTSHDGDGRGGASGVGNSVGSVEDDFWRILQRVHVDTVVLCGGVKDSVFDVIVEAAAAAGCRLLAVSRYAGVGRLRASLVWYRKLPFVELTVPALRGRDEFLKRALDIVVAGVGLVVLLPLFAVVAVAIKLESRGHVFFAQERVGMGGRVFRLLKFRTMRDGADGEKQRVAHLNQSGDPRLFKIPNDPRVTRVGGWLRKWSLDELPQLVNVLRGEMSLVGPRPFFESDLETYSDHHFGRLGAKPGMTGLWQVSGRSAVDDFEEVVRLDCEYIDRWSLWLDAKILFRTLPAVLSRRGAF